MVCVTFLMFGLLTILLARKDGKIAADLQQNKERLSAVAAELKRLKESDVRNNAVHTRAVLTQSSASNQGARNYDRLHD